MNILRAKFCGAALDPNNSGYTGGSVANLIHTEDDGAYTFGASDFADIPAGAHIEIVIGRGNYQIAPLEAAEKKWAPTTILLNLSQPVFKISTGYWLFQKTDLCRSVYTNVNAPLPIPNRAVKPASADGTAAEAAGE